MSELTHELDPEKEITDITFDFEGSHMALCHRTQGYSANNKPQPMLVKAEDQITDEAAATAEHIKAGTLPVSKDSFSEGVNNNHSEMKTEEELEKSPSQPSEKTQKTQGELMADQTDQEKALEKAADLEARLVAMEKAAEQAEADKKELTDKVESFEKANQERLEKAFVAKVETYSFITEEEREDFAKALLEVDSELVILALDKAQKAIVALSETQGVDGGEINLSKSSKTNRVRDMILKEHGLEDVSK